MDLEASELRVESCGLSLQYYTCLYLLVVLVLLNTCYILTNLTGRGSDLYFLCPGRS